MRNQETKREGKRCFSYRPESLDIHVRDNGNDSCSPALWDDLSLGGHSPNGLPCPGFALIHATHEATRGLLGSRSRLLNRDPVTATLDLASCLQLLGFASLLDAPKHPKHLSNLVSCL